MRKAKIGTDNSWPSWRHSPDGTQSQIFQCEADVPAGWTKKPGTPEPEFIPASPLYHDRERLIEELLAKGIDIGPQWGVAHMKKVLDT